MRPLRLLMVIALLGLWPTLGSGQETRRSVTVRVAKIASGSVVRSIQAAGVLRPWRDVTLASQVAGTAVGIHCHMGQWVRQGDLLVELDDELAKIAVQEASAAAERAQAQLRQSTTDLERAQKLRATDDISEAELEAIVLRRTEASAALAAAQAQLQRAERTLRDTHITAPFAGSVAERIVEVGSWVTPGQPVVRVVELSRMKAEFGIPQQRTPEVSIGMSARLTTDLFPGVVFQATVHRIGVVADPASGQFSLEVSVPQSQTHPLMPGTAVRLDLDTQVKGDAILVPKEAVLDRGGATYVLMVDRGNRARLRQVVLGSPSGASRELLEGDLRVGDSVITAGKENVADGDQIELEAPATR